MSVCSDWTPSHLRSEASVPHWRTCHVEPLGRTALRDLSRNRILEGHLAEDVASEAAADAFLKYDPSRRAKPTTAAYAIARRKRAGLLRRRYRRDSVSLDPECARAHLHDSHVERVDALREHLQDGHFRSVFLGLAGTFPESVPWRRLARRPDFCELVAAWTMLPPLRDPSEDGLVPLVFNGDQEKADTALRVLLKAGLVRNGPQGFEAVLPGRISRPRGRSPRRAA